MSERGLTGKQQMFALAYVANGFNASKAAKTAGYKGNGVTLRAVGYENLTKPHIRKAITALMTIHVMPQEEVLARLGAMAGGRLPTKTMDGPKGATEVYDARAALELIGKHFALFTERIELGGTVEIKGYMNVSPDDWPDDETEA